MVKYWSLDFTLKCSTTMRKKMKKEGGCISKDCVVFLDMKPIRGFGGLSELHTREETSIKSAYTSSSFRLLGFFSSSFRMKETEQEVNTKTNIIKSTTGRILWNSMYFLWSMSAQHFYNLSAFCVTFWIQHTHGDTQLDISLINIRKTFFFLY